MKGSGREEGRGGDREQRGEGRDGERLKELATRVWAGHRWANTSAVHNTLCLKSDFSPGTPRRGQAGAGGLRGGERVRKGGF